MTRGFWNDSKKTFIAIKEIKIGLQETDFLRPFDFAQGKK
jgi:hypothetical protein